jgi:Lon-like ATP-dependent protease
MEESIDSWILKQDFKTTNDIKVPPILMDQVIGQDDAVAIIKKAAIQKRHCILIGDPGTGKSMLAQAMVDFISKEELEDIMVFPNEEDPNKPKIKILPAGKGKELLKQYQQKAKEEKMRKQRSFQLLIAMLVMIGVVATIYTKDIIYIFYSLLGAIFIYMFFGMALQRSEVNMVPKLLVGHDPNDKPPFIDATGTHTGALLGDVRHDPFQSGGLETAAHIRVEAGAIHKANKGVLFIDEINLLRPESQQALLTAMQEKKFPIVGQSERSAGAMVQTESVPCDFVLVAAGNIESLQGMHPALRSRIRGYGYEIYMNNTMEDNETNRQNLVRFVQQEIKKDGKIPAFDRAAVAEIIKEAQKRAGRKGKLTLRLRELGGLIRVAGDIAKSENAPVVTVEHINKAKSSARPLEQQIVDKWIESKKEYKTFLSAGSAVGMVNGLAVYGAQSGMAEFSGIVLPILAEITPAQVKSQGRVIATGKLGDIAKEAVQNVSAIVKKYSGEDISNHDVHIQFIGTYEGVEGDSASVSIATAVISALENIPIRQDLAMTGSLSIRGHVLPIGGVIAKIEAAIETGFKTVIIPSSNLEDVVLDDRHKGKIEIVPADTIVDVLKTAFVNSEKKDKLITKIEEAITPIKYES